MLGSAPYLDAYTVWLRIFLILKINKKILDRSGPALSPSSCEWRHRSIDTIIAHFAPCILPIKTLSSLRRQLTERNFLVISSTRRTIILMPGLQDRNARRSAMSQTLREGGGALPDIWKQIKQPLRVKRPAPDARHMKTRHVWILRYYSVLTSSRD